MCAYKNFTDNTKDWLSRINQVLENLIKLLPRNEVVSYAYDFVEGIKRYLQALTIEVQMDAFPSPEFNAAVSE